MLLTLWEGIAYCSYQKGGKTNASLLREVPSQEGDERRQVYHHEEWEAGYSGCMSHMWDKDVQNRKSITDITPSGIIRAGYFHKGNVRPIFIT